MGATRLASVFCCLVSRQFFLQLRPAELKQRLTDKRVISAVCEPLFSVLTLHFPDARRVAPISGCVWCMSTFENSFNANVTDALVIAFGA